MNYESIVIAVSAVLYFSVSVSYFLKKQYEWSFVWLSYSMANIGLILAALKK